MQNTATAGAMNATGSFCQNNAERRRYTESELRRRRYIEHELARRDWKSTLLASREEGREEMIRNALLELPVAQVAKLLRVPEKLVAQVASQKGDSCLRALYSRGLIFENEDE